MDNKYSDRPIPEGGGIIIAIIVSIIFWVCLSFAVYFYQERIDQIEYEDSMKAKQKIQEEIQKRSDAVVPEMGKIHKKHGIMVSISDPTTGESYFYRNGKKVRL